MILVFLPILFLDAFVAANVEALGNGGFFCIPCGTTFKAKKNMERHVRDQHTETHLSYECPKCKRILANMNAFSKHIYKLHNELKSLNLRRFAFDNRQLKQE